MEIRPSGFNTISGFVRVGTGVVFRVLLNPYEPINTNQKLLLMYPFSPSQTCYNFREKEEGS